METDMISLRAIFASLWRNAWIILITTAIGAGLAYHYAFNIATPTYRATASVVLETAERPFVSFEETTARLSGDTATLNTQIGVLQGFDLLGRVVADLGLDEDPEFNRLIRVREDGTTLAETLDPETREQLSREISIRALLSRVEVRNLPNSLIFEISTTTTDPVKSMTISNAIAQTYITEQVERKVFSTERATDWLRNRVSELQEELQQAEARVDNFRFDGAAPAPESLVQLEQLTSEAEAVRTVYRYLLTRLQETTAQQGLQRSDSRILSSAMLPLSPNAPRHMLLLVVGAFVGGFLGLVIAFVREALDRKMRDGQQLEELSGLPVLGELPDVSASLRRSPVKGLIGPRALVFAEALENLAMTLTMSRVRGNAHVIVLLSAKPGEGKTSLAMSMAERMGKRGQRTLLVDADTRKQTISQNLDYSGPGLLRVIERTVPLEEAVMQIEGMHVDLLGNDPQSHPHRSGSVDVARVRGFLDAARQTYDVVVIDTPPVRAVADALPFGKAADTVLLLAGWNYTRSEDVHAMTRILRKVDIEPAGYILSRIPGRSFRSSQYDGYLAKQ